MNISGEQVTRRAYKAEDENEYGYMRGECVCDQSDLFSDEGEGRGFDGYIKCMIQLLIHVFFNLNRVCKIGTPIALRLTYLMPEAASSFYTLLHVGKDANMISIDLTLVRRK